MIMTETPLQRLLARHPEIVQARIAEEADISQSHLSLIISGDRMPSVQVGLRLCAVLRKLIGEEVTFESLFGRPDLRAAAGE